MTTTILDPRKLSRTLYAQGGISEYTTSQNDKGNTVVHGLKVFRSGTFRDSMGVQRTWEPEHMAQFASNFDLLRENGIFPNVPVRDKHESFLGTGGDAVGYVQSLQAQGGKGPDGEDVVFLVADFEFTEPAAAAKLDRGTFRARSAEVGVYETNGEAFYWPVFLGFAFVAIGAVEGLYSKYSKESPEASQYSIITEGNEMPPEPPPAGPPAPPANPFQFSIGGQQSADYAAVQAHITRLESENATHRQFEKDAETVGRENFVKGLSTGLTPKIHTAQVADLTVFAQQLDQASYEAWVKTYDNVPPLSQFANHALPPGSSGDGTGGGGTPDADKDRAEILADQIKRHTRAGAKLDQVQKMGSYVELQAIYTRRPELRPAA